MAEPNYTPGEQPRNASESPERLKIINRLRAERGESPLPSQQESETSQQGDGQEKPGGDTSQSDEKPDNSAQRQETQDDDGEYDANDTDGDEDEQEPDGDSNASADDGVEGEEDDEGEPGHSDTPAELLVDDRRYTADDIRELHKRDHERDADYRRKTAVNSRIRQEYEETGTELTGLSNFFVGMAEQNLKALEAMDPQNMSQEEFGAWKQQVAKAKAGVADLKGNMEKVTTGIHDRIKQMRDHQAAESAEILKGIDSRWNVEFYAKIRDFAVESGRYSPETFKEVRDWQTLEGLIALYDAAEARRKLARSSSRSGGDETNSSKTEEPRKRKRRRNKQRRSEKSGQFQNAQQAAMDSRGAIADGTFRAAAMERLRRERGE